MKAKIFQRNIISKSEQISYDLEKKHEPLTAPIPNSL